MKQDVFAHRALLCVRRAARRAARVSVLTKNIHNTVLRRGERLQLCVECDQSRNELGPCINSAARANALGLPSGYPYVKIGTIQRRLAWPLRKDDTLNRGERPFFFFHLGETSKAPMS